jgi:predicted Zn finger-like uncharacterized protein
MFTQCPDCETTFRVSDEVLQLAEGRVRCGGCGNAFNALDRLSKDENCQVKLDIQAPEAAEQAIEPDDVATQQNKELLETLDRLAGTDVQIEDTGVEWRVLDDVALETGGKSDADNTGSIRFVIEDEPEEGAPGEAMLRGHHDELPEPVTNEDEMLASPAMEYTPPLQSPGERRYGDDTVLPEDFGVDDDSGEPPYPGEEIVSQEPARDCEKDQDASAIDLARIELAVGEPDDWVELLDEVHDDDQPPHEYGEPMAAANDEAVEVSAEDDTTPAAVLGPDMLVDATEHSADEPSADDMPSDIDTQILEQAEALGLDVSGNYQIVGTKNATAEEESQSDGLLNGAEAVPSSEIDEEIVANAQGPDEAESDETDTRVQHPEQVDTEAEIEERSALEGHTETKIEQKLTLEEDSEAEIEERSALEGDSEAKIEQRSALEGDTEAEIEQRLTLEGDSEAEIEERSALEGDTEAEIEQKSALEEDTEAEIEQKSALEEDTEAEIEEKSTLEEEDTKAAFGSDAKFDARKAARAPAGADENDDEPGHGFETEAPEHEVPPQTEEEMTINQQIDEELLKESRKIDLFASAARKGKDVSRLFDEGSAMVETIIMEGETIHDSFQDAQAKTSTVAGEFKRLESPQSTFAPDSGKVRGGRRASDPPGSTVIASVVVLCLLLFGQILHQSRQSLATFAPFSDTIGSVYRVLGKPVIPKWDVRGWQFEATKGSVAENEDSLTIYSRIANKSDQALPYPLIHVSLTDRWEETIGSRVLEPNDYLVGELDPKRPVAASENFGAVITIDSPSADATGFKLNVCYRVSPSRVRCATEDFKD